MRKDTGFSIIELMVVMGIMAIISAIAVPGMLEWLPKQRIGSAARDVKSTLEFARSNAIKRNMLVEVDIDWANDSLTVVEVIDPVPFPPIYGDTLRTLELPDDVDLLSNGLVSPVTFNGHGFSTGNFGAVAVVNASNNTLRRTVNLTPGGNTRIQ
ncbi:MAG: prepilin-type N-terminal cleavage/methylation domain-containing protein [bacterium]|nr:prepilin-type N-terminal cleavage/methylation domain-containing protein [bacterium]